MDDPVFAVAQVSAQEVLKNERPEVPDMSVIIDRRSAGIESNHAFFQRMKLFVNASQSVVQFEHTHLPNRNGG
jgi:hypothetical protein